MSLPGLRRRFPGAWAASPPLGSTFRPISPVVFVNVTEGISACELLAHDVRGGPLGQELAFPYHPHVTVAHDLPAAGLDAAYDGLAGFEARFPVTGFTAFEQAAGGVWVPRREFQLGR